MCARVSSEVDIAIVVLENVDKTTLQHVRDSEDFLLLPTYLAANTWMFNPRIAAGITLLAGQTVRLDLHTLGLIWYACVLYLNDPMIIAQNPWLLPITGDVATNPIPIWSIYGCGLSVAAAPISNSLTNLIDSYLATTSDPALSSCVANFSLPSANMTGGAASLNDAYYQCMSAYTRAHSSDE